VHERLRGLRVLRHVGQRFGGDEVGGRLDRLAQLVRGGHAADLHRHGSARGERLQRRPEAAVAEQRRVDAPCQLAQLLDGELGLLPCLRHQLDRARGIALDPRLGESEGEGHGNQPLLGAVVEIALDAPALFIGGGEDALPGVAEVVDPRPQRARTPGLGGLAGKAKLGHPIAGYLPGRRVRDRAGRAGPIATPRGRFG
jgi:hypothetical protein